MFAGVKSTCCDGKACCAWYLRENGQAAIRTRQGSDLCVWCDSKLLSTALENSRTIHLQVSPSVFESKRPDIYRLACAKLPNGFTRSTRFTNRRRVLVLIVVPRRTSVPARIVNLLLVRPYDVTAEGDDRTWPAVHHEGFELFRGAAVGTGIGSADANRQDFVPLPSGPPISNGIALLRLPKISWRSVRMSLRQMWPL
jgi:hypothetical protein